jgi:predicted MFS family arabinose efflux permease
MTDELDANRVLLWFMLLSVLGGTSMGMAQIATTLYAVNLGASSSQIGMIGGAQGIGFLCTVLPIGFLVDHVGPRKVFFFGAASSAVAYLLFPFVRTAESLCWFVAVVGFFTAFRFIPMSSVFLQFVKQAGSEKAGWQRGSHSFGLVFLGPLLGGVLSRYWGFNMTFQLVSVAVVIMMALGLATFPDGLRADDHAGSEPTTPAERIAELVKLFKHEEILEASLAEALALATFACFNAFIVVMAIRIFHFPSEVASLFVSLEGISYIATLFLLWRLLDSLGSRQFYLISILVVIAGLLLLSILWHPAFLFAGTLLIGLGLGMFNLVNVTRIARTDVGKGKIAGVFSVFTVLGSIIGPVIGGIAGEWIGGWSVFLVFIPFYLILGYRICFRHNARNVSAPDSVVLIQTVTEEY